MIIILYSVIGFVVGATCYGAGWYNSKKYYDQWRRPRPGCWPATTEDARAVWQWYQDQLRGNQNPTAEDLAILKKLEEIANA
jgi:hypothetical protein